MRILRAGAIYFGLVFAAGFILGFIRVLWLVPRLGERTAELLEAPIMLVVIIFAARWIVRWFHVPTAIVNRLGMGTIALAFHLAAEFSAVLWLRSMSIDEYFATRDTVAGAVYVAMLAVFVAMPLLVVRS